MKNYELNNVQTNNEGKPFGVWISSLGHYNEGELTGGRIMLPATKDDILKAFQKAKIGEQRDPGFVYEEHFITDYDDYTNLDLANICGEYANIEALNLFAKQLEEMGDLEYETFCAYCEVEKPKNLETLYAVAKTIKAGNEDIYLYEDVCDDNDLGHYFIENTDGGLDYVEENVKRNYFDYTAYGEYLRQNKDDELLNSFDACNKTDYELGWAIAEEIGISDYDYDTFFDYEGYGRDIRFETLGGFSKDGFIEYPNGTICAVGQLEKDLQSLKQSNKEVMSLAGKASKDYKTPQHDSVVSNKDVGSVERVQGVRQSRK